MPNDPLPAAEDAADYLDRLHGTEYINAPSSVTERHAAAIRATIQLCRDLQAENQRFRREILAAGTMQDFDWSVLERLDALDGIKCRDQAARIAELEAEVARLLGEPTHPVPITEAFQRLAEASGDHWDGFDPQAYVRELRDGNTKGGCDGEA